MLILYVVKKPRGGSNLSIKTTFWLMRVLYKSNFVFAFDLGRLGKCFVPKRVGRAYGFLISLHTYLKISKFV